ncbi:Unc119b [Chytridium lagenaria]|nr:Unc119b [Chytridium lagenaria]
MSNSVKPQDVLRLSKPTEKYLCSANTNKYAQFVEFKIRDLQSNKIFFEVKRPSHDINWNEPDSSSDEGRSISYKFTKDILTYPSVGTTLVFAVGPKELKSFRMVERHYFKDRLLKSFDFSFGFCIPNSVNTWESVYTMPNLDPALINEIVASPGKTQSDSFYFVDDKLIMHNKAFYTYY